MWVGLLCACLGGLCFFWVLRWLMVEVAGAVKSVTEDLVMTFDGDDDRVLAESCLHGEPMFAAAVVPPTRETLAMQLALLVGARQLTRGREGGMIFLCIRMWWTWIPRWQALGSGKDQSEGFWEVAYPHSTHNDTHNFLPVDWLLFEGASSVVEQNHLEKEVEHMKGEFAQLKDGKSELENAKATLAKDKEALA
ncbi:hypothetical protein VNO78_02718 [Psophocarpus tetragonolobus]|uniref:Uncharacterized protein n=1 Tax=Psophocarpus tetragonolobus TaxID=3891 RepID=A0AAN9XUY6_PSOTE